MDEGLVLAYLLTGDPFTRGHLDIVSRSLKLRPHRLVVGLYENKEKKPLLQMTARLRCAELMLADLPPTEQEKVVLLQFDDDAMALAERDNVHAIVRGLRGHKDFDYEEDLAQQYRILAKLIYGRDLEVFWTLGDPSMKDVSSTVLRYALKSKFSREVLLRYVNEKTADYLLGLNLFS